jgi:hypothetical protein
MALPSSGAISFSQIQTEFGGTNPISLSEYYNTTSGLGLGISSTSSIPSSGAIAVSNFYGAQKFNFYATTNYAVSSATAYTTVVNTAVDVSSTSAMNDRWIMICAGARTNNGVGGNSLVGTNSATLSATTGTTGTAYTAVNRGTAYASYYTQNIIYYKKVTDGVTSVNLATTNLQNTWTDGNYGDGEARPNVSRTGGIVVAVYIITGVPTLTHYGLQQSGIVSGLTGSASITMTSTSVKSFALMTFYDCTNNALTNGTYYSESGYYLNQEVGTRTYTSTLAKSGTLNGVLFNY